MQISSISFATLIAGGFAPLKKSGISQEKASTFSG
jgi:hypothetical protein